MPDIANIAENADMIVNGYAFTLDDNNIRVLNLNAPDRAVLIDLNGDVLETSMDDIEIGIVLDYFKRNREYMEVPHA